MIQVTRLNHLPLILNADLIEHIEANPDTVISLTSGQKIVVLEAAEEVVQRVIAFRKAIHSVADHRERLLSDHSSGEDLTREKDRRSNGG